MIKRYLVDNKELMKEWNKEKNIDVDINKITEGMGLSVWWKCFKCGYEWKTRVNHRTKDGTGCPECRKKEGLIKQQEKINERLKTENLEITHPELIKDWDYEKNELGPEKFLAGMGTMVWWKCSKCRYEWKTRINHRTKDGTKCPNCSKQNNINKLVEENGSLEKNFPNLLSEWNYKKNDGIDPQHLTSYSNKKVWWKCKNCGHEWKSVINNRVKGIGCPECGKKKSKETLIKNLIEENGSLFENNPKLAKEFHPTKNGDLTAKDVMEKSPKKVWWKCSKCHYEWEMSLYNRSIGGNCPKCLRIEKSIAKSTPILGINDLESQNPELANEWHPTKNEFLTPRQITISSNKKVWWLGKCGHEWQATVGSRKSGGGCPKCLKEFKISYPEKLVFFYLKKTIADNEVVENYHPTFLKQKEYDIAIPNLKIAIEYDGVNWHKSIERDLEKDILSKNNNYTLIRIRESKSPKYESNSIKIYYDEKDEINLKNVILEILDIISSITNIKYHLDFDIERDRTKIYELLEMNKKDNSIAALFPDVIKEWHPTKNGLLKPEYISAHTHKKMWWICPKGHAYQMVVKHKTEDNCKCPICSSHRILVGYNDLNTLSPEISKEWDYEKNKPLTPKDVMFTSNKKVWWICPRGHSYNYSIAHRTKDKRTCPICSNRKLLKGYNDLVTINKNIASEWNYEKNKNIKPDEFTPISGQRVWWKCSKCNHEWNIKISSRFIKGNGCPRCNKKYNNKKK